MKSLNFLPLALAASIALHMLLLAAPIPESAHPSVQKPVRPHLQVVLAAARHAGALEDTGFAAGGAQVPIEGKGVTESAGSPVMQQKASLNARVEALEITQQQADALREQQSRLLGEIKATLALLQGVDLNGPGQGAQREGHRETRTQLAKQVAEIEKRIEMENARARRRYVGPESRDAAFANYYENLRRRIEQTGTRNFPNRAGRKLYGELTLLVTIESNGRVLSAEIIETSKIPALDQWALRIVRAAGPFGAFSDAMHSKADRIVLVSRFDFTRQDFLETQLRDR